MEEEKEEKINFDIRFVVMGINSEGLLCDTLDDIRMFVVVENTKPKKLLSEGVYTLLIQGKYEVGDYVAGFVDTDESIQAKSISSLEYESYRDEIVGRIISGEKESIGQDYYRVKVKI